MSETCFHFRILTLAPIFRYAAGMEELGRNRKNRAVLLRAGREMGRAFTVAELHGRRARTSRRSG